MPELREWGSTMAKYRHAGWTLYELLLSLVVLGVLSGFAVPGLERFLLDAHRTSNINGFVLAVQLARSEAAKRGRPAVLCASPDGLFCSAGAARYDSGWIVFVNADDLRPPRRSSDEPLLYVHAAVPGAWITGNRALFEFRPFGKRSTNGTVTFCDRRGPAAARAVIVSYTGRPRVSPRAPGGQPLSCAGLP